jgi:hypothetical protein
MYVAVLSVGLLTLPTSEHQIQEPWFTLMEFLIIAIAPAMVALTVALHAMATPEDRPMALLGIVFLSLCAVVTCTVHFSILVLSRHPAFDEAWHHLVFTFRWPSLAYALDILAWDFFFPLGALCAALVVPGVGPAHWARVLMICSSVLALVGLLGVPLANMQVRNIAIFGYAVLFPIAAALLAGLYYRADLGGESNPDTP